MKLTVKPGKRDKLHIYLDDEYRTTVDALYFGSSGLRDGMEIGEAEAETFLRQANERRAFNKASSLLSLQDRTRRQLIDRLTEDFGEDAACAAVDRLEALRLVDDARYARNFADELRRRKNAAPRRIRQELISRGIDADTADETIADLEFDPRESIGELLRTRFCGKFADEKGMRRTVAALQRLGYGYGDIRAALRDADDAEE
jgi:regulatory protein